MLTEFNDPLTSDVLIGVRAEARREPGKPGLSHWTITANQTSDTGQVQERIATMQVALVNFAAHLRPSDGFSLSANLGDLMQAYWNNLTGGNHPLPNGATVDDNGIAAFVMSFAMEPGWHTADATPLMAVEMLSLVAASGATSAWLDPQDTTTTLASEHGGPALSTRQGADMWNRAGFTHPDPMNYPTIMVRGLDPLRMADESQRLNEALSPRITFV